MAPDTHRDAATAALVAASLGHGRSLDRLSQGLLLLALAALLVPGLGATTCGLLLASLIPAGVQAYHAFRCSLDAHVCPLGPALPRRRQPSRRRPRRLRPGPGALLRARPGAATPRPLDDRARGALFLRRQAMALACQSLLVLAALVTRLV